jgi:hypothetical protein
VLLLVYFLRSQEEMSALALRIYLLLKADKGVPGTAFRRRSRKKVLPSSGWFIIDP